MWRGRSRYLLMAMLAALAACPAPAQHLFATDTNHPSPSLRRFTPGGGDMVSQAFAAGTLPEGVAYDDVANQVYWVEATHSGARIRRTDPALGPGTTLISGLGSLRGIVVDPVGGRMYWTASDQGVAALISRADLDGSNVQVLFAIAGFNPRQIALDRGNGWIYWTEFDLDGIARSRLDGTEGQWVTALPIGSRPYGIAVNEVTQELYWTEYGTGEVEKMPLPAGAGQALVEDSRAASTTTVTGRAAAPRAATGPRRAGPLASRATSAVITGLNQPTHLTLDVSAARMYVSQAGVGQQAVRRANLDGTGLTTLPVPQGAFGGIVFTGAQLVDVPDEPGAGPAGVALSLAARNPARGNAELSFGLPAGGRVRLAIYDAAGREVATVAEGEHAAGPHRVTWTGRTTTGFAAPGVYVARLEAAGRKLSRRFAYLR